MNDKAEIAAHPEPGNPIRTPDQSDDEPGSSTASGGASGDHHAAGPSLLQRALGLFRQRNGTSLREEIVEGSLGADVGVHHAAVRVGGGGEYGQPRDGGLYSPVGDDVRDAHQVHVGLGVDGVGVIVSVGRNVRLPVGLRVAYHQSLARDGSFAEFTLADARGIIPIPDSVDNVTAAALPCPALTAWQALEKVPPCDDSRDILVVGAGGAVGLFLSQLALRRRWRVWVTASPAHNQRLLSLGVSGVFDYCTDDWRKRLQNMLGPRKLHAVFDTVSGRHASSLASMIGYNGHLICIQDRIDENPLAPFTTAISLHEVALNSIYMYAAEEDWRDWRDAGASLFDMCSRENLEIPVIETFEFSVLPTALSRIKNKLNSGKSVVCL